MKHLPAIAGLLLLAGCAEDRYKWNLSHATVTAHPPLPRSDVEAIVRVVTRATVNPIFSIVRVAPKNGREQVSVAAAAPSGPVDSFMLEKVGPEWHIAFHDESSDR
jgi:hypothetical protein